MRQLVSRKLRQLRKKSVVVLGRATYHTVVDEEDKNPVTSWNKGHLVDVIRRLGGSSDDWPLMWATKKSIDQLLDYTSQIYPCPKYKIQKIADKFANGNFSIKVLFLPVAHPELNPIEMVWGFTKRAAGSKNMMLNFRMLKI